MRTLNADIKKRPRTYLPETFSVDTWESVEPYFEELLQRPVSSTEELQQWLRDMSELEAAISEDACWRQIRMTRDTENKDYREAFNFFCLEIQPRIQPYADKLNRKLISSPYVENLDQDLFFTYLRAVKKQIELFREENIPLQAELSVMQQQYGQIAGKMLVEVDGKEYTLQQAAKFLENPDRSLRETVYRKINGRRLEDKDQLNDLYTQLIQKRHQVALNAGFENFRDYKFAELGRFDYTKEDCFLFHNAVKQHIVPLVNKMMERKKSELGLDDLRPWDTEAEPEGVNPLRPFKTGDELLRKSINCFNRLNPFFGSCLKTMEKMGHFDLESRQGKAPGGYNCPLAESGAPFIFMNAAGQMHDVTTMVHEGGHAIHSFLAHELELSAFKEYPMEVAELASMSMELFSMEYWDEFFDNKEDLRRARIKQLERSISVFPWIAIIDKFQHWVYENPNHSIEERVQKWLEISKEFSSNVINHEGLEDFRSYSWQKQLHLYEVPFYYIEYGIAQLGAIGMWKQFKNNKEQALTNYINALSLGGTKTLIQLYETAGIRFDLSPEYIGSLASFVQSELEQLYQN